MWWRGRGTGGEEKGRELALDGRPARELATPRNLKLAWWEVPRGAGLPLLASQLARKLVRSYISLRRGREEAGAMVPFPSPSLAVIVLLLEIYFFPASLY